MSHVDFSVVTYDVEGTWSADAKRGKEDGEDGQMKEEKLTRGSFWP